MNKVIPHVLKKNKHPTNIILLVDPFLTYVSNFGCKSKLSYWFTTILPIISLYKCYNIYPKLFIKNKLKNLSWFAMENISSSGIELLKSSNGFDNSKNIRYGMLDK